MTAYFGAIPYRFHRGQLELLLIRKDREWGFPNGRAKAKELIKDTIARVLMEATSLKVQGLLPTPIHMMVGTKVISLSLVSVEDDLASSQVPEVRWITINEARSMVSIVAIQQILQTLRIP